MPRSIPILAASLLFLAVPLLAQTNTDTRAERQQLVRELLKVIDSKKLTQSMLDVLFNRMLGTAEAMQATESSMPKEQLEKLREQRKKQEEDFRVLRERLWARVDFATYDEKVYVPLFEKTYSSAELRELLVFFKTKAGQKTSALLADLSLGAFLTGSDLLSKDINQISEEMHAEDEAKKPKDQRTMSDLRSVATAIEAYATDENHYPKVSSYGELKSILSPIYIRDVPEKDAWGTPYRYSVSTDGSHYRLVSAGSDGQFEGGSDMIAVFDDKNRPPVIGSTRPEAHIIYQDGGFVQAPEETAKKANEER